MYFEYHLDADLSYIDPSHRDEVRNVINKVSARMEKLEEALTFSFMKGETFAKYAKILFDGAFDRFESMSAEELSTYVDLVSVGCADEPTRLYFPNAETVLDTAFVRTEEWQGLRHLGVGGSDAAAVLGLSKFQTPRGFFYEKRYTPELIEKEDKGLEAVFARGHFVEPNVIKAFCRLTGAEEIPETRMFRSKKYPMATANIDAFLNVPGQGLCIFEAKTTVLENRKNWKDEIPSYYVPQIKHYESVLDDERIKGTYIGCIFTDDIKVDDEYCGSGYNEDRSIFHFLPRNPDSEQEQLSDVAKFWTDHILTGNPPDRTVNAKKELEVVRKYEAYPDPEAPEMNLNGKQKAQVDLYLDLNAKKKEYQDIIKTIEEQQSLVKDELLIALGERTVGRYTTDDTVFTVSNKYINGREGFDSKKLQAKYPDAYNDCLKQSDGYFRFTVSTKKVKAKKESAA